MQPLASSPDGSTERILLTVDEAADKLRISRWTLNRLVQERQLASVTIGTRRLIPLDDISRFVEVNRVSSEGVRYAR